MEFFMRSILGIALAGFVAAGSASAAETKYTLTGENTTLEWVGSKPDGKHKGGFKKLKGTLTVDPAKLEDAKVDVEIDTTTLHSDNPGLTMHLKGPDFFNVKKHPTAKFVSTKVTGDAAAFTLTGKLTLLGKTKEVEIPVKVKTEGDVHTLVGETTIDRTEFGMNYGRGKVDDKVALKITIRGKAKTEAK
jgi:polyisoprenoid-binding protein YceI